LWRFPFCEIISCLFTFFFIPFKRLLNIRRRNIDVLSYTHTQLLPSLLVYQPLLNYQSTDEFEKNFKKAVHLECTCKGRCLYTKESPLIEVPCTSNIYQRLNQNFLKMGNKVYSKNIKQVFIFFLTCSIFLLSCKKNVDNSNNEINEVNERIQNYIYTITYQDSVSSQNGYYQSYTDIRVFDKDYKLTWEKRLSDKVLIMLPL
jgi:hypothetical protein